MRVILLKITKLNCGCQFETDSNNRVLMEFDISKINLKCQKTWDLISSGHSTGLFQIDSGLGQTMSKQLKPQNIDHLAALISIMRPSCLKAKLEDGKSIAEHFIDRKNNKEPATAQYSALEPILKDTYNLMIFQEQSIKIGQEIAGMSLQDSDHYIRYGIGKKKSDIIAKGKDIFLDGCKKVNKVNDKEAPEIWAWIESAQRYQFNAGHSYSYAYTTYWTAIAKTHFTKRFFKSYLNHSYDKPKPLEEIKNLVLDSKAFEVDICNPDLRLKNKKFIEKGGRIYFGLEYIKEVGENAAQALLRLVDALDLDKVGWTELVFKTLLQVNRRAVTRSIGVGAMDYLKINRKTMLYEFDITLKLSQKEIDWIVNNLDLTKFDTVIKIFQEILSHETGKNKPISNKTRKNIIKNLENALLKPPFSVISSIEEIINWGEVILRYIFKLFISRFN
jgi:DNA polymerase-3 subunit alpha